ncbi:sialidase-4-like [Hippoglossus hippoglossus]|uniref:sialidase-4-like n=1 Tax=Hippoglossus hippoglossus TaxID=8267 RepID=UPI00148D4BFD|nr:sialidase-4-like [Hippoglossus hippoglossus]
MGNTCVKPSENQLQEQLVFDYQDGCVYRIPALCYNRNIQTLLAFAEKWKTLSDSDAEKLVMKTAKVKEDDTNGRQIHWTELKEVKNALLSGHCTMNPCPVYDEKEKTLYLFFNCVENSVEEIWQINNCCNKARLCYITTTDDGENWSVLTDLTPQLQEIGGWATFAVGPGHGLQTNSGRLIVPVYAYPNKPGSCASTSYALALYADHPYTEWQFGNMLETESGECQMADLLDDEGNYVVYCNARSTSGHQVEAVSVNVGVDFAKQTGSEGSEKIVETGKGCQGSVVSFPADGKDADKKDEHNSSNTWRLYTHPTHVEDRVNLGVYLNKPPKDPNNWSKSLIINSGTSGYSDLAYIGKGWFVCLMERGEGKELNQISSVMFSYSQVEEDIGQYCCCSPQNIET